MKIKSIFRLSSKLTSTLPDQIPPPNLTKRNYGKTNLNLYAKGGGSKCPDQFLFAIAIFNERKLVLGLQHVKVKVKVQMEKFGTIVVLP